MPAIVIGVHAHAVADLPQVVLADRVHGRLPHPPQEGQKERDQDGDDGDDHQQLDERESANLLVTPGNDDAPPFGTLHLASILSLPTGASTWKNRANKR